MLNLNIANKPWQISIPCIASIFLKIELSFSIFAMYIATFVMNPKVETELSIRDGTSLQVRPFDSCAELRRLWAPARTGSNRQYSHFQRNVSAPVDLLLRRGSAGCSWLVTISRRYQDVTNSTRLSKILNICLRRTLVATDAASGRTDTSTTVYSRKHVRANSIDGALYNHAPHYI